MKRAKREKRIIRCGACLWRRWSNGEGYTLHDGTSCIWLTDKGDWAMARTNQSPWGRWGTAPTRNAAMRAAVAKKPK